MKNLIKLILLTLCTMLILGCDALGNVANDVPSNLTLSSNTITENNTIGDVIGSITAVDDIDTELSYSLGGDDEKSFAIVDGNLVAKKVFDHETKSEYSIQIGAMDSSDQYVIEDLTITIIDEESVISISSSTISENVEVGTTVGSITISDYDDNATYTLSGTNSDSFSIISSNLVTAAELDFETTNTYEITISTDDNEYTLTTTIYVTNIKEDSDPENTAPTDITLTSTTIAEDQISGTTIGTLSATDDYDLVSDIVFTLSGDDAASFSIDGMDLNTATSLDYDTQSIYSITIIATDSEGLSYSEDTTITVTAVAPVNDITDYMVYWDLSSDDATLGSELTTTLTVDNFSIGGEGDMYDEAGVKDGSTGTQEAVASFVSTDGALGGYMSLSSNRVDYVKVENDASGEIEFDSTEDFSISVWVRIDTPDFDNGSSTDPVLFDHYDSSTYSGYKVEFDQVDGTNNEYEIEFLGYNGTDSGGSKIENKVEASDGIIYGDWNHFVFTYQGESSDGTNDGIMSVTINSGTTVSTEDVAISRNADNASDGSSDDALCIGGNSTTYSTSNLNKVLQDADLDELYIYNKVLSDGEIDLLYEEKE